MKKKKKQKLKKQSKFEVVFFTRSFGGKSCRMQIPFSYLSTLPRRDVEKLTVDTSRVLIQIYAVKCAYFSRFSGKSASFYKTELIQKNRPRRPHFHTNLRDVILHCDDDDHHHHDNINREKSHLEARSTYKDVKITRSPTGFLSSWFKNFRLNSKI